MPENLLGNQSWELLKKNISKIIVCARWQQIVLTLTWRKLGRSSSALENLLETIGMKRFTNIIR